MNTCINCHSDYEIKEGLLKNKCEKCSIMLRKKDKKIAQRRKEEGYFKTPEYKATHKKYEKRWALNSLTPFSARRASAAGPAFLDSAKRTPCHTLEANGTNT